jgi:hypothetical protein
VMGRREHKNQDLYALGLQLECDRLVTNGELATKLDRLFGPESEPFR